MTNQQKLPPNSQESEEAVLGSVLLNPYCFVEVAALIGTEDFLYMQHRYVFEAMRKLVERGAGIDALTVCEQLREMRDADGRTYFDKIGGSSFITTLINNTPTHIHVDTYARIVEKLAVRRRLLDVAGKIGNVVLRDDADTESVLAEATKLLDGVIRTRKTGGQMVAMNQAVRDYLTHLEAVYSQRSAPSGVATGYDDLDKLLGGGLQPSDLIITGARPGVGKTSLMMSIAINAARQRLIDAHAQDGHSVAIFSLEMSREQLVQRFFSGATGIGSQQMRSATFDDAAWERIVEALPRLEKLNIHIDDKPRATIAHIKAQCQRLRLDRGLDLIIIDYLQLMGTPGFGVENRVLAIGELTRSLKEMAKEFNVPVLVAAQLNRAIENRSDKRPQLSDLRESGNIEADADVVILLSAEEVDFRSGSANLNINVAKHRNGPVGTVALAFQRETTTFRSTRATTIDISGNGRHAAANPHHDDQ